MPAEPTPAAELDIDPGLVRALLTEQHADLATLPLELVASGWDNAIFRLGDDLSVRLPRRRTAATLVEHEQRWLPSLASSLPLPVPVPLRAGAPSAALGYPWSWTVCPWLPGWPALHAELADPVDAAVVLGAFVASMHRPAPSDAPHNPVRGIPLAGRTDRLHECLDRVGDDVDAPAILATWDELVATAPWTGPPLWLHGGIHPANVLVDGAGRVCAVIDFGDLTAGDPATDLAVAWMLFGGGDRGGDDVARAAFRAAAGVAHDDDTWQRGRGWALAIGVALVASSADDEAYTRLGHATISAAVRGDRL